MLSHSSEFAKKIRTNKALNLKISKNTYVERDQETLSKKVMIRS